MVNLAHSMYFCRHAVKQKPSSHEKFLSGFFHYHVACGHLQVCYVLFSAEIWDFRDQKIGNAFSSDAFLDLCPYDTLYDAVFHSPSLRRIGYFEDRAHVLCFLFYDVPNESRLEQFHGINFW